MANGVFALEAVQADQGDCLLLHYGPSKTKLSHALIDGGPRGIYEKYLKQCLAPLAGGGAVSLDLVMVSHIDDDHIHGIIDFFKALRKKDIQANIDDFWFNSFDDASKEIPAGLASLPVNSLSSTTGIMSGAVLASVKQGQDLRDLAKQLALSINAGSSQLVLSEGFSNHKTLGGLALNAVGPSKARLTELYEDWKKKVAAQPANQGAITTAYLDKSVYNLSSIVVIASYKNKTMLLTGDARGDDVLAGLSLKNLLASNGTARFDLLKVPHHGSNRNVEKEFFEQVIADHYVISANGMHDNPDAETLQWIYEARSNASYKIYLTNDKNQKYPAIEKNIKKATKKYPQLASKLLIRKPSDLSIRVEL